MCLVASEVWVYVVGWAFCVFAVVSVFVVPYYASAQSGSEASKFSVQDLNNGKYCL